MKTLTKTALLVGLMASTTSFAQTSGNPNNTGLAPFDNNTGKSNNGINPGTKSTAPVNGAVKLGGTVQKDTPIQPLPQHYPHHKITKTAVTLNGFAPENKDRMIELAKGAGATEAKFKGNVLICTGRNFDIDSFTTSLSATFPKVTVTKN